MTRHAKRSERGAVLVEFVVAIVPILMMFFTFVQLSKVATARLIIKHATIVGARAAAVIANEHDNVPDQPKGGNRVDIEAAVKNGLGPWWYQRGGVSNVQVRVDDRSSRDDPYGWVEVRVSAVYMCNVPMGWIACRGRTKLMEESYRMPHQGARYRM
jgi:hypothetical protein